MAQGCSQKFGCDYNETFSPVIRFQSVQIVISLAVQNGLKLHQMDVTTAFLNGELEEVYMKQPEGFIAKGQNLALDSYLKKVGFIQAMSDPCLYIASEGELFIIGIYVDDILLAGKSDRRLAEAKKALTKKFKAEYIGDLHYFVGVKIIQNQSTGEVWTGQPVYAETFLQKFGMGDAKPAHTPVHGDWYKLTKATEDYDRVNQKLYQSAVGNLLYLLIGTRPDIA